MRYTLSVLVENRPGVLAQISSLLSRRGFNIESIAAGITNEPDITRITLVVKGDKYVLSQVTRQLEKLVDVITVRDFSKEASVDRELLMVKVKADAEARAEILQITEVFRARVVDMGPDTMILEMTGDDEKITALTNLLAKFGVLELARTGKISLLRGHRLTREEMDKG
ncbi:MAG: acetolactate synthase small subunit [Bacillota bacterium]